MENKNILTTYQVSQLLSELEEYPDIEQMILQHFQIDSLFNIPLDKYDRSLERIREIKLARKGHK